MPSPRLRLNLRWLMSGVLILNLLALGSHLLLRLHLSGMGTLSPGAYLATPAGLTTDGQNVTGREYEGRPCHVLRYESARCSYCTLDQPQFEQLAQDAGRRTCSLTIVAPAPDQFFPSSAATPGLRLAYPTVETARTLPAYGTPTTVVTNAQWAVVWAKRGALTDDDPRQALAALR